MASSLADQSPIMVGGLSLPTPQLFQNIPMLHGIMKAVLEDWLRTVEPYQSLIDDAEDDSARLYALSSGFMDLQPTLLKCLFSYAFFFVATNNAYGHFYRELNQANHVSGLKIKHQKPPSMTPFVRKVGAIRDIAIAHFPAKKVYAIDAFAAMSWQPMSLAWAQGDRPDLEKLTFAPGRFRATDAAGQDILSQDLELPGVKTMHHEHCLPYLEQYDKVCCEYLNALQEATRPKGGSV